jgi:hypothetical protein
LTLAITIRGLTSDSTLSAVVAVAVHSMAMIAMRT